MRSKIVEIKVRDPIRTVLSDLNEPGVGEEIRLLVGGVAHGPVDFVAQPVTERETRFDLPIVLDIETNAILINVAMCVAKVRSARSALPSSNCSTSAATLGVGEGSLVKFTDGGYPS